MIRAITVYAWCTMHLQKYTVFSWKCSPCISIVCPKLQNPMVHFLYLHLYFPLCCVYYIHMPTYVYTHSICWTQETARALERRGNGFIYLFEAWLGVLTDGSISKDGRQKHVSNTGGLICQAGRHPLCALHLKWWCCSLLKHHLLKNFGTDHLSCLPACGRVHLLWFWREQCKTRGSQNLLSLQNTCSLILRSFQSSERIQSKHASPTQNGQNTTQHLIPPPSFPQLSSRLLIDIQCDCAKE